MYRVLIIEDEELLLWAIERHLIKEGYFTLTAKTGEKAKQLLRQQSVDLVVSDLHLPDLPGTTMVEEIRRLRPPSLPVVAITASSITEERVRRIIPLTNAVLWKPFRLVALVETLHEILSVRAPIVASSTRMDSPGECDLSSNPVEE